MAKGKKSFILYQDNRELWEELTDEEAGKLIKHIFSYISDENPVLNDKYLKMAFLPIKATLKRDLEKWRKQHEQRIEAGKRSAEVRKRNATSVNERSTSSTVSVSDSVSDSVNVNVNDIVKRKAEFKNSLHPFLKEYSSRMIQDFFEYWTEHGENDKKMRFEKEKSFGIKRRLSTWNKREKEFNAKKQNNKHNTSSTFDETY